MTSQGSRNLLPVLFLLCMAALIGLCVLLGLSGRSATAPTVQETEPQNPPALRAVVIDPGHGGEDGGTQSDSGVYEKDLNLTVALLLRDILEANGVPVVMTRDEDVLLYDRNGNHQGHKKQMDLASRLSTARHTEDCLFISIHMNSFPQSQYHGLQVWYGKEDPLSAEIAADIQSTVRALLQNDNARRTKAATDSIYLLKQLKSPAVLVECGFLSNPEEAERLSDPVYQQQLALAIASAIMPYVQPIS